MGITFALAATRVLPTATSMVIHAQGLAVTMATPLLLLNADLRGVWLAQPAHVMYTAQPSNRRSTVLDARCASRYSVRNNGQARRRDKRWNVGLDINHSTFQIVIGE